MGDALGVETVEREEDGCWPTGLELASDAVERRQRNAAPHAHEADGAVFAIVDELVGETLLQVQYASTMSASIGCVRAKRFSSSWPLPPSSPCSRRAESSTISAPASHSSTTSSTLFLSDGGRTHPRPQARKKGTMKKFFEEFKEFINQGNVMDLAVAVVIGTAFTAIVNSVVSDLIMPLISLVTGGIDFGHEDTPGHVRCRPVFTYGNFINAVIQFLIIALVVFLNAKASPGAHADAGISKSRMPRNAPSYRGSERGRHPLPALHRRAARPRRDDPKAEVLQGVSTDRLYLPRRSRRAGWKNPGGYRRSAMPPG